MSQTSILVCFAVKEEARPFQASLPSGSAVKVIVTGMGKANAIKAVSAALEKEKPDLLLTCGFAGGLRPELKSGTVVYSAPNAPQIDQRLSDAGAVPARFHCAERVAVTVREKQALREATGADAVEMESGPICGLCKKHGIPHATVRIILDTAEEDLPLDFNQLMTADLRVSPLRLAAAIAKAPLKIPALIALGNQSRRAAALLADALAKIISITPPKS